MASAPPPPSGLPRAAPPPPAGLPGSGGYNAAPKAPMSLPKSGVGTGKAPAAPSGLPGSAPLAPSGYGTSGVPPAPGGLPSSKGAPAPPSKLPGRAPAAPLGLPGGSKAPAMPMGLPGGKAKPGGAPPPPMSLPVMSRAGPSMGASDSVSAPPPPIGLPGGFPKPGMAKASPSKGGAPPPPMKPPAAVGNTMASLPTTSPVEAAPVGVSAAPRKSDSKADEASTQADTDEPDDQVQDDSWRQYLQEDSEGDENESEPDDSGEDSDEDTGPRNDDRHKSDMDALFRQQALHQYQRSKEKGAGKEEDKSDGKEEMADNKAEDSEEEDDEDDVTRNKSTHPMLDRGESPSSSSPAKKKSGMFSRLAMGLKRSEKNERKPDVAEDTNSASMLTEDITEFDDAWYGRQLARLQRDGVSCTKIGTNGKPYERRIHVDSRNLTIEVRGGRTGATGVLLDDLIDVRRGLSSPEFEQFCKRFKKDAPPSELAERALVLQTPHRTFSFLLPTVTHRGTVAFCILFLLKSKNRGVMASGERSGLATRAPKEGFGSVSYPNKSRYEGNFHNHMRHGMGTLTLSDGTKYESEWKHDERHGEGKELCPDGTTFTGSYVKGMRHGHGVMTWPEGSKYSGQFERGRANGEGELLRTDGSVYRGQFSEDCMSGEGRMQWRDGVEYIGQFVGNRREGFGRMHWTSGRWKSYEGYWKDGLQHGEGTLIDHSNQEYRGVFRAGKLERWDDDGV